METNAEVGKYYKFRGEDGFLDYFGTEDMRLFRGNAILKCIDKNSDNDVKFERFNDWVDITDDLWFFEEVPNPCITSTRLTKLEVGKCYRWVGPKYTSGNRPKEFNEEGYMDFIMDGRTYKYGNEMTNYADMVPLTGDLPSDNHWKWCIACPYLEEVPEPNTTSTRLTGFEVGKWYKWKDTSYTPDYIVQGTTMAQVLDGRPVQCKAVDPFYSKCASFENENGATWSWTVYDFEEVPEPKQTEECKFEVGKWYRATKNLIIGKGEFSGWPRQCIKSYGSKVLFSCKDVLNEHTIEDLEKYKFVEDMDKDNRLPEDTTIKFEEGKWYRTVHSTPIQVEKVHSSGWVKFVGSSETSSPSSLKNLYLCDPPVSNPKELTKFEVGKWYRLKDPKNTITTILKGTAMEDFLDGKAYQCKEVSDSFKFAASFNTETNKDKKLWAWTLSDFEEVINPCKEVMLTEEKIMINVGDKFIHPLTQDIKVVKRLVVNNLIEFEDTSTYYEESKVKHWIKIDVPNLDSEFYDCSKDHNIKMWYSNILTLINCDAWKDTKFYTYYINKSGYLWRSPQYRLEHNNSYWYEPSITSSFNTCYNTRIKVGCTDYWDQCLIRYDSSKEKYCIDWVKTEEFNVSCRKEEYFLSDCNTDPSKYTTLCKAINNGINPNIIKVSSDTKIRGLSADCVIIDDGEFIYATYAEDVKDAKVWLTANKGRKFTYHTWNNGEWFIPESLNISEIGVPEIIGTDERNEKTLLPWEDFNTNNISNWKELIQVKKSNKLWLMLLIMNHYKFTQQQFILLYFILNKKHELEFN